MPIQCGHCDRKQDLGPLAPAPQNAMTAIDKTKHSLAGTPALTTVPDAALNAWQGLWTQVAAHTQNVGAHPARTVVLLPFFQLQVVARAQLLQRAQSSSAAQFTPRLETTKSWSQRIGHFSPGALDISYDAGLDSLRAKAWLQRAGLGAQQAMLVGSLVQTAHQLGTLVAAVPPVQRSDWAAQARTNALQGLDKLASTPLMYEAAVARIALEWAVASRYTSDVLFDDAVRSSLDALIVVPGLQANPLAQALAQHWADISCYVQWPDFEATQADSAAQYPTHGQSVAAHSTQIHSVALHPSTDQHDEADRAAACVLQHIAQGRVPVALAAVDRLSTRRISATLQLHGVQLLDETGWKLSTTRAAASVMALLRAARTAHRGADDEPGADDALLNWLKQTNAPVAKINALEHTFRKQNSTLDQVNTAQAAIEFIVSAQDDEVILDANSSVEASSLSLAGLSLAEGSLVLGQAQPAQLGMAVSSTGSTTVQPVSVDGLLKNLRASRSPAQWLLALQYALRATGQWAVLQADSAGRDCVQALHLLQPDALADHGAPMSLAEFTAWASDCLENASFKPSLGAAAPAAQVIVLPLAQVLARPFAAIVIAGADEQRLPASPEPVGAWTRAQRAALGLPTREALAAEQQRVWACAMQLPQVDVLWRTAEGESALQPSPLLLQWQAVQAATHATRDATAHSAASALAPPQALVPLQALVPPHAIQAGSTASHYAADPRRTVSIPAAPTHMPTPVAGALRVTSVSASSYSDLRACPYRFFALRLLGLQDAPELDTEVDKRDFGSWLHSVLGEFHTRRKNNPPESNPLPNAAPDAAAAADAALLDQCATDQSIPGPGFVPYAAAWPQVRASYLAWLTQHEAEGWQFDQAELSQKITHPHDDDLQLVGRLDRVDRLSRGPMAGTAYVLDYKTESSQASKNKVKTPMEDTQLAFYAALLGEDDLHAAYINLAERDCKTTPQPDIMAARDALLHGIAGDVQRIHAGAALPALGEGSACDFCAARGLCRKDMWTL
jgi:ATP-dependent helicase/nuclease subunit B